MNNFFLLVFIYLFEKVFLEYETIKLISSEGYYFIPLNFPSNYEKVYYIFSTRLPMSFFPSLNCSKCTYFKINETKFQDENSNVSIPYFFYNYYGRLFSGNYSTEQFSAEEQFLAFDNLSYALNYSGRGRYSLSFLNYNFNTSNKIFAIKFLEEDAELHLGDYDHNRKKEEFKTFDIETNISYEDYNETIIVKDNLETIFDNNLLIDEDDNTTHEENISFKVNKSSWYIKFPNLKIKKSSEKDVDHKWDEYKLTLDMCADRFYIPRKFFVENVQNFFPKDAKCQVARGGYFVCDCDEDYKSKFGNFKFISDKGVPFWVNVTDYMTYQSSISGSRCNVHIVINYDNDLFIGGTSVLNNYYTIFDVDNKALSILPRDDENTKETGKYLALFFIILILACAILFGWYYYYNKYVINDPTGLVIQNNNNNRNNNIRQIGDLEQ